MKKIVANSLIKIIDLLLWCICSDYRVEHDPKYRKFTHIQEKVMKSEFGNTSKIMRTVPYQAWLLRTENYQLIAADDHLVFVDIDNCIKLKYLTPGDYVMTKKGKELVIGIQPLNTKLHMYDVEIDHYKHCYYSNGILSHNTTVIVGYLLWFAMFNPDSTILIAANKYKQALEIMKRVRYAYEMCPDYIRAGVTNYAKGYIDFDNGSTIISEATTETTGRGLAISCLYLDEFAFVPPRLANDFWTSIQPTLSTGGKCIITSTPNSDVDEFAQIWHRAEKKTDEYGNITNDGLGLNKFYAFKATWREHPDRDEQWAENERASIGAERFEREHECVAGNTKVNFMDKNGYKFEKTMEQFYFENYNK